MFFVGFLYSEFEKGFNMSIKIKIFSIFFLILTILSEIYTIQISDINNNLKIPENKLSNLEKIYVSKVIDGDTIKSSNNKTIRLIGINTPEIHHPDKGVEYFGKEAASYTRKILEGETVYLEYDIQKKDKYSRELAYIFLKDGTFFNAKLVLEGYADLMTIPPNLKYTDLFKKLAKNSRKLKKGLWKKKIDESSKKSKLISWKNADKYYGQKVTMTGKIIDTHDSGKVIFLNFAKDYRNTFTAVIFKSNEYKFDFEPEKSYLNKYVFISGVIKKYKGAPEIIIEEPGQISVQ